MKSESVYVCVWDRVYIYVMCALCTTCIQCFLPPSLSILIFPSPPPHVFFWGWHLAHCACCHDVGTMFSLPCCWFSCHKQTSSRFGRCKYEVHVENVQQNLPLPPPPLSPSSLTLPPPPSSHRWMTQCNGAGVNSKARHQPVVRAECTSLEVMVKIFASLTLVARGRRWLQDSSLDLRECYESFACYTSWRAVMLRSSHLSPRMAPSRYN